MSNIFRQTITEYNMLKEFIIASTLTIVFSVGVGVLFVQTIYELIQLFMSKGKEIEAENTVISLE